MNRRLITGIAVFCFSLMCVPQAVAASTGSGWFRIRSLQAFTDGYWVYYYDEHTKTNPNSCGDSSINCYSLLNTDDNYETKSATLLAALLSDKEVYLYINNDNCNGSHPRITNLYIRQPVE